jgi:LysM repeat protein
MKKGLYPIAFSLFVLIVGATQAQTKLTPTQYIEIYAPTAVSEMERSGIPASITLAQGLLESNNGNSPLATVANNHFGIKCHKEWTGDTYYQDDDEKNECFRYYQTASQSYTDHTDFLKTRSRYEFLFSYDKTDYVAWANGLKQAGYATNPQYPTLLVDLINRYGLGKYDKMTSNDLAPTKETLPITKYIPPVEKTPPPVIIGKPAIDEGVVFETQPYYGDLLLVNNIKAVKAKKEDTPMGLAMKYNVPLNYLYKYNDMHEGEPLIEGQNVFIQPKRNKGFARQHQVKEGESMYQISQCYGIKLAELYKKNKVEEGQEVVAGEFIYLRDDRDAAPKTMSFEDFLQSQGKGTVNNTKRATNTIISTLTNEKLENSINENKQGISAEKKTETSIHDNEEILSTEKTSTAAAKQELNLVNDSVPTKLTKGEIVDSKQIASLTTKPVITYEIKAGDTLYNLSKRFNVSVEQLVEWNKIVNNYLKLGQIIVVNR